jgi:hypothetical protein
VSRGPEEWFVMKLPEQRAVLQESRLCEKQQVRVKN